MSMHASKMELGDKEAVAIIYGFEKQDESESTSGYYSYIAKATI